MLESIPRRSRSVADGRQGSLVPPGPEDSTRREDEGPAGHHQREDHPGGPGPRRDDRGRVPQRRPGARDERRRVDLGGKHGFESGGLSDQKDFVRNAARAVTAGLPADAAIRAHAQLSGCTASANGGKLSAKSHHHNTGGRPGGYHVVLDASGNPTPRRPFVRQSSRRTGADPVSYTHLTLPTIY